MFSVCCLVVISIDSKLNASILLRFGGKEYSGLVTSKSGNETRSLLELRSVTHSDEGKYFCLSVNEYGSSQAWTELDVYNRTQILSGPRDLVQNSGGAVSLPCQVDLLIFLQTNKDKFCLQVFFYILFVCTAVYFFVYLPSLIFYILNINTFLTMDMGKKQ